MRVFVSFLIVLMCLFHSKTPHIPMIPFGLKETKLIDFSDAFKVGYKLTEESRRAIQEILPWR